MALMRIKHAIAGAGALLVTAGTATAQEMKQFHATDGSLGFQEAAGPLMHQITSFHNFVLPIITLITLLVLVLLIVVGVKFRASANPTPSKTTHNTMIEVAWTVIPIFILFAIAVPSLKLLNNVEIAPDGKRTYFTMENGSVVEKALPAPAFTIKATGYQWYWGYNYPDNGDIAFEAYMLDRDAAAEAKLPALLGTDYPVVIPVGTTIRVQVTANDVIHNWAMPAMGIKTDAVPGRLNETWIYAEEVGDYFGQCSELCGVNHAFMPIWIRAVPADKFEAWAAAAADDIDAANATLTAALEQDSKATELAAAQ